MQAPVGSRMARGECSVNLYESLPSTFDSGPIGRLQLVSLKAVLHLAYMSARNRWEEKKNRKDLQIALMALESWGRDDETDETADE